MGIYDRDYYRAAPPRGGFGMFSIGSVTAWLIIVNVAVFLIDALLYNQAVRAAFGEDALRVPLALRPRFNIPTMGPIETWGYFSVVQAVAHLELWRFVTFQFLHANFAHLFSNMLSLFLFGPIVENDLGPRRFLGFYLLCGCSGAVAYLLLLMAGVLQGANVPLVGASAGIFGVLVAGAILAPDVSIVLLFPPIPIQLKYMALILVGWAAYTAFTNGYNAGGQAAHLGGAVLGYALIRYPRSLDFLEGWGSDARARRTRGRRRTRFADWSRNPDR
jgi:membrane associated rhomboid family serine protease